MVTTIISESKREDDEYSTSKLAKIHLVYVYNMKDANTATSKAENGSLRHIKGTFDACIV